MKKVLLSISVLAGFFTSGVGYATDSTVTPQLFTCQSSYALCDNTVCTKSSDGSQAVCNCPVYKGKNTGGTTCAVREATAKEQQSTQSYVYSDYSPIHLITSGQSGVVAKKLADPTLMCHENKNVEYQYADCFDVKCTMNSDKTASCTCPIISGASNKPLFIDSANCLDDRAFCKQFVSSSSELVVNSAPPAYGTYVVNTSLASYGLMVTDSMFCSVPVGSASKKVAS